MATIRKLLVANRGEIAIRVFRTCRDMGIATVAVFSDADASAPFVAAADEAIRIGPAPSVDSYLRIDRIIAAARTTGADAIHPGYGFLSENADLAAACEAAGIAFVGPRADTIRMLGRKVEARVIAARAGVPTIPVHDDPDRAELPVLIKASAGGGGKGMRIVRERSELPHALESARREALASFGDDTMLIENYIDRPRHVEIQILGDHHGALVHLLERDCSVQRRHQKVIEETPSPALDERLREAMGAAALAIARATSYVSAGTVEFVLAPDRRFYFLEVNTRLQVEHPVTEMTTGIDIVREQIRIAQGERLELVQDDIRHRGAAIECRLYAEDAAAGDLPGTGQIVAWQPPDIAGLRIDAGVAAGTEIGIHYDPLLAKLICHALTRSEAIARLARALERLVVFGVPTNRELLVRTLRHPAFVAGDVTTHFLDDHAAAVRPAAPPADVVELAAVALALDGHEQRRAARAVLPALEPGFRNSRFDDPEVQFALAGEPVVVRYRNLGGRRFAVRTGDLPERSVAVVDRSRAADGTGWIAIETDDGRRRRIPVAARGDRRWALIDGITVALAEPPRFSEPTAARVEGGCVAPMPGKVTRLCVASGAEVTAGQILVVLEAMKMEHSVRAPRAGVVVDLCVAEGDQVAADDLLVVVKPADDGAGRTAIG